MRLSSQEEEEEEGGRRGGGGGLAWLVAWLLCGVYVWW